MKAMSAPNANLVDPWLSGLAGHRDRKDPFRLIVIEDQEWISMCHVFGLLAAEKTMVHRYHRDSPLGKFLVLLAPALVR